MTVISDWFLDWWLWIAVSLVASTLNLLVAFGHFTKRCRYLPLFNPWLAVGVWWWVVVQLVLPSVTFWLLYSLSTKPPINVDLITKAITFGLIFTALVNAYVDTGYFGVNIKDCYTVLTELAYKQIAAAQTRKTAEFWTDLKRDLTQGNHNLTEGLDYLESYFRQDVSLTDAEKQDYQARINQVRSLPSRTQQIATIEVLMEVRRKDLREVLKRFGCSKKQLDNYFSK